MTLGKQHDKPVYVRLRETIADAILTGKNITTAIPFPPSARWRPRSRPTR